MLRDSVLQLTLHNKYKTKAAELTAPFLNNFNIFFMNTKFAKN